MQFEKKRLIKKQLIQKLQEFENKNIMQFTQDSNGDNNANDEDDKDKKEEDEDEDDDEDESKSETPVKEKNEEDNQLTELLENSLIDPTERTREKDTSHPINQTPSNEYGSVGTTCVFSIVQYNKNDDNYQVCLLFINIKKLTNIYVQSINIWSLIYDFINFYINTHSMHILSPFYCIFLYRLSLLIWAIHERCYYEMNKGL